MLIVACLGNAGTTGIKDEPWFILSNRNRGSSHRTVLQRDLKGWLEEQNSTPLMKRARTHTLLRARICVFYNYLNIPLQKNMIFTLPSSCLFCSLNLLPPLSGKRLLWNPSHINYFLFPTCPVTNLGS